MTRGATSGLAGVDGPRVPSTEEITELLTLAKDSMPGEQLRVNPDCGLKTRGYAETTASLENLIAATKAVHA